MTYIQPYSMSKYRSSVSRYVSFSLRVLSPVTPQDSLHACEDCDISCLECKGPGPANCTECPIQAIREAQGRCLLCCRHEEDEEEAATQQQDCCNCTETRGRLQVCVHIQVYNPVSVFS